MLELLGETFRVYKKNLGMVLFFSIPFLISLLIPLASPAPTYSALGGYFLRSGSMPEMSSIDIIVVVCSVIVSLYLLSFALVAINLVVKASRTRTRTSTEVMRNIGKYTAVVFALFLAIKIIETAILYVAIQRGATELIVYVFGFLASLGLFYVAPAVVLEERKPIRAFTSSYAHIVRKPLHFLVWLVLAFVALSVVTGLTYAAVDVPLTRQIIIALISSLVILPLLIIFQAQIYLTKYTILK